MDVQHYTISTLRTFEVTNNSRAFRIFATTFVLFIALVGAGVYVSTIAPWLVVLFTIPIAIMLCRCFALVHDLGHLSFFTSKTLNRNGALIFGWITMVPSVVWQRIHDTHHGLVGNLDKRNVNPEIWTLTVAEFKAASPSKRFAYRLFRTLFVRLIITPMLWMIAPRIPFWHMGPRIFISMLLHNITYAVLFYFIHINGWWFEAFWVYLLPLYLFNFAASIMFYVQHQFEDTSWEKEENWSLFDASIRGSSYVDLGPFFRWMTGNVGCHHVHHLNTRIPCYNLRNATEEVDSVLQVDRIHFKDLWKHFRLSLWDEEQQRLIRIKDVRK